MHAARQLARPDRAVTAMNLRNLPRALGSSLVAVVGIAGVVTVSSACCRSARASAPRCDRRAPTTSRSCCAAAPTARCRAASARTRRASSRDAPGVARDAQRPDRVGRALRHRRRAQAKTTGTAANVPLRGVSAAAGADAAARLRDHRRAGCSRRARNEVIVGRGAAAQFAGLEVGNDVRWGTTDWNVVGHFRDRGSVAESEVWTDAPRAAGRLQPRHGSSRCALGSTARSAFQASRTR